jgi:hypothetical protein
MVCSCEQERREIYINSCLQIYSRRIMPSPEVHWKIQDYTYPIAQIKGFKD